jgi:hypothetical protein
MSTKPSTNDTSLQEKRFISILEEMERNAPPAPRRKKYEPPSESFDFDSERIEQPQRKFIVPAVKASELPRFNPNDW